MNPNTACFQGIVDSTGRITSVVSQISCNPTVNSFFDFSNVGFWVVFGIACVVIITLWFLIGYPRYHVWSAKKSGEADLQEAHQEQQIQVSRAQGRLDAATKNKEAAIIEAEAVAAQIDTIGKQLTQHDLYLKWQWIEMMKEHSDDATIYIPTEAGLPILEAGRLPKQIKAE